MQISRENDNIEISIPPMGYNSTVSLYYYSLASTLSSFEETSIVLQNLIQFWIDKVLILTISECCLLPFEFEDEYIGCLKVTKLSEECVSIKIGYSSLGGYTVSVNNPEEFSRKIETFELDEEYPELELSIKDLTNSLLFSKENLIL